MKSLSICALVIAGLCTTGLALADPAQGSGQFGPGRTQDLDSVKQRIEQRIQEHITKMQTALSCVQGAQDRQTLRQCLPKRRGHRRGQFGGNPSPQGQQ